MSNETILMWNLESVERDIFEIEGRITLQHQRIEQHNRRGGVPESSLDLLTSLKRALSSYHQRRRRILRDWGQAMCAASASWAAPAAAVAE
jgi:hypothetical protein